MKLVYYNMTKYGLNHDFQAANYNTFMGFDEFMTWLHETFGTPHGPGARWYFIGKEVSIRSAEDALLVFLRWDVKELPYWTGE